MAISDYFKPVVSMTAEESREFFKNNNPGDYNLVDVRQPTEYEEEHIPGSHLLPLGELPARMNELDPDKPTIAY